MEAKRARRHGHPRRPALHAHERAGRPPRPDPRRAPTSPSSAASSATCSRATRYFREYVVPYTNAATILREDFRGHRGARRRVLRLRPRARQLRPRDLGVPGRPTSPRPPATARARDPAPSASRPTGRTPPTLRRRRPSATTRCSIRAASSRSSAATSPATRRRWSSEVCGVPRERSCAVADALMRQLGPRAHDAPSATPSAGRSTRPASRYIRAARDPPAAARATSAARAAGSWRCAATPRSRARPTSRRSTTCCPATCRCRARASGDGRSHDYVEREPPRGAAAGRSFAAVRRLAAEGLVRRRARRPRTTTASATCRGSPATTRTTRRCCAMLDGEVDGPLRDGREPGRRLRRTPACSARACAQLDWLVVRDLAEIETATFWRDAPEVAARRARARGHRHRGLPHARRGAHREGRARFTNTAAAAPVARQGGRARRATRARSCGSCTTSAGACGSSYAGSERPARPADRSTSPGTTRVDGPAARARRRGRAARRSTASTPTGRAARRLRASSRPTAPPRAAAGSTPASTPAASTRRPRATPGARSRATGSRPSGAGPGRRTAASSTTARRPIRRAARGRSASATSGGTPTPGRWTGDDVPDFPLDTAPDYRPPDDADGHRRDRRRRPVHHEGRRQGRGCSRPSGLRRRPAARRTTSRSSRRSPTRSIRSRRQSRRAARGRAPGQPVPPAAGEPAPSLPLRPHDLPPDRAPHGRRHVAAGCPWLAELQPEMFVRDLPRARGASAGSRTAAG